MWSNLSVCSVSHSTILMPPRDTKASAAEPANSHGRKLNQQRNKSAFARGERITPQRRSVLINTNSPVTSRQPASQAGIIYWWSRSRSRHYEIWAVRHSSCLWLASSDCCPEENWSNLFMEEDNVSGKARPHHNRLM